MTGGGHIKPPAGSLPPLLPALGIRVVCALAAQSNVGVINPKPADWWKRWWTMSGSMPPMVNSLPSLQAPATPADCEQTASSSAGVSTHTDGEHWSLLMVDMTDSRPSPPVFAMLALFGTTAPPHVGETTESGRRIRPAGDSPRCQPASLTPVGCATTGPQNAGEATTPINQTRPRTYSLRSLLEAPSPADCAQTRPQSAGVIPSSHSRARSMSTCSTALRKAPHIPMRIYAAR